MVEKIENLSILKLIYNSINFLTGVEASNTSDHMKTSFLVNCLRDELSERCVEFLNDASCSKVARFRRACPDVQPRKDKFIMSARFEGGVKA